jgi:hypothetical protein
MFQEGRVPALGIFGVVGNEYSGLEMVFTTSYSAKMGFSHYEARVCR